MLATQLLLLCLAQEAKVPSVEEVAKGDTEVQTDIVVAKGEWSKYNNCEDPENCAAPCTNPQGFHVVMCDSYTCRECVSDWCVETCQGYQRDYPTCRCASWPDGQKSYAGAGPSEA